MQQKNRHARAHTQHTHKSVSPSCLAPTVTRKPRVRSRQQHCHKHLVSGQWPSQSPGSSRHVPQTRSTPCSDGASLLLARVSIRVPWGENRRHVFDPHAPSTRASDCMFEVRVACQRHHRGTCTPQCHKHSRACTSALLPLPSGGMHHSDVRPMSHALPTTWGKGGFY